MDYTIRDIAKKIGKPASTIHWHVANGHLKTIKVGGGEHREAMQMVSKQDYMDFLRWLIEREQQRRKRKRARAKKK